VVIELTVSDIKVVRQQKRNVKSLPTKTTWAEKKRGKKGQKRRRRVGPAHKKKRKKKKTQHGKRYKQKVVTREDPGGVIG